MDIPIKLVHFLPGLAAVCNPVLHMMKILFLPTPSKIELQKNYYKLVSNFL